MLVWQQYTLGDDLIMAGLKDVVMHEVGHTLGLRHNFKASSGTTWEQTQNYTYTQVRDHSSSTLAVLIGADLSCCCCCWCRRMVWP